MAILGVICPIIREFDVILDKFYYFGKMLAEEMKMDILLKYRPIEVNNL